MRRTLLSVLVAALGAPLTAAAQTAPPVAEPGTAAAPVAVERNDVSLSFTNDLEFRLQNFLPQPLTRVDGPPPKAFEEVNRFTARAGVGDWGFNIQVDQVAVWGAPYRLDGEVVTEPPALIQNCGREECVSSPFGEQFYANPEKIALTYNGDDFEFTVGDFYSAFGYGVAVNLNRNVDIDVDTSIQGVRVVGTPGKWELTGMAGMLNRQQVFADNQNINTFDSGRLLGDLRHLISGVRVVRHELGPAAIGVHGVAYDFTDTLGFEGAFQELNTQADALIGGATLDLYGVGGVDWQFEADVVSYPVDDRGQNLLFPEAEARSSPFTGHSLYGSAQFFIGRTIWQVDAKKYKNFQRLNRQTSIETYLTAVPPLLEYERAINFNTAASAGSDDIWGGRIRMDLALGQVTPYFAVSSFRDEDLLNAAQKSPAPETIFQGQGGVEVLYDDVTLLVNALGRTEIRDGDNGADTQIYGDVDVKIPLPGTAHADVIVFGQRFLAGPSTGDVFASNDPSVPEPVPENWTEASVSVTVAPNHVFGVTGFFDYTTNPFAQAGGNLFNEFTFGAVELYVKPSSSWMLRAFHGGYASGIRCSGGQCRFVPAFTGTRLAVTGTF